MRQANKYKKNLSKKKRGRTGKSSVWWVITVLGGILLVVAALFTSGLGLKRQKVPVIVKGQPALKVNREKVDLGDMKFNTPASVTFTISNQGDEPLSIRKEPTVEVVEGC